jgi:hypothetical protein
MDREGKMHTTHTYAAAKHDPSSARSYGVPAEIANCTLTLERIGQAQIFKEGR